MIYGENKIASPCEHTQMSWCFLKRQMSSGIHIGMPAYFTYSRLMFAIMEIVQVARTFTNLISDLFVGSDVTQIYHQGLGPSDFPRSDFCTKMIQTRSGF